MAYKTASHLAQAKLRRPIPRKFGGFEIDALSDQEYIDLLRRNVTKLEQQLFAMAKDDPSRKQIAANKQMLSDEIRVHRNLKKGKGPGALANKFMDVVRLEVSKDQFEAWITEANRILDSEEKDSNGT